MDSAPGSGNTIDHFRLEEPLGTGGMGVVYRAEDLLLHRRVALKLMRPEHVTDARHRERFLREARTAAALVHPNIATIYEVGESDATIFIAMELVPGESLRAVLSRGSPGTPRALAWATGIASALACAHQAGVVHRDLKPDNVMVLPDDQVKLLDFGIAKAVAGVPPHALTSDGAFLGSPGYVSPEQARSEAVDVRSDIFSFGSVLFEMLTGAVPFARASAIETLAAISRDPAPRLRERDPGAPAELDALVARCLERARTDRFADGGELLTALKAIASAPRAAPAGDTLIEAPAATAPPAISAPPARRSTSAPRLLAALGLGGAAVAAVLAVLHARTVPRPTAPTASLAPNRCTSSAACSHAHGDGAWRCNAARQECVEIPWPQCTTFASKVDLASDDTVWIGALMPTTGPFADDIVSERRALELAQREIDGTLGSSAGRDGGLRARPIAVVLCDENVDAVRQARHLAEDVEVPAIVGFRWTQTALDAIPTELLPRHVLSFVSISQASQITKIPQAKGEPRLVWHSAVNSADTARPLAALVGGVLEPELRRASLGPTRRMHVALVRTGDPARSHDLTDVLLHELRFNGRSALENGDDLRQFVYDAPEGGADHDAVVAALLDFAPEVVIYQGLSFVPEILVPLEARWKRGPRPYYLVDSDLYDDAAAYVGSDAERRRRFFGVTSVTTRAANAELVLHYNLVFPGEPVTRSAAPAPSYDAFYTLAYAAESVGQGPIDGLTLSRAMQRLLPPGPSIEVGPGSILDAFQTLRAGGNIDLEGAVGSLDFDPATGEAPIDYEILCFGVDDRGRAFPSVAAGLTYDSKAKKLSGTLRCP